jgi:hypothetical protein
MSDEFNIPSRAEIDEAILNARHLRAEYIANAIREAFGAVASVPSRIAAVLHRPAHG